MANLIAVSIAVAIASVFAYFGMWQVGAVFLLAFVMFSLAR